MWSVIPFHIFRFIPRLWTYKRADRVPQVLHNFHHSSPFLVITHSFFPTIMRITSSILTFIFLGVAAGRVIPELAVRDSAIKGVKRDQGDHTPLGLLSTVLITPTGNPSDPPHSFLPSGLSDRPEPTGKHPHPTTSCSDAPTDVPHPSVVPSSISGQPQPTYSHPAGVRRDVMSNSPPPGTPSGIPPPPPSGFPSGFPSDFSDHPKPTGRPPGSHTGEPTGSSFPPPIRRDSVNNPPPPSSPSGTPPPPPSGLPSGFPSDFSDHPKPTDSHSHPPTQSHYPAARRANPNSERPIPTTDSNTWYPHSFDGSDHPIPTGSSWASGMPDPTGVHSHHHHHRPSGFPSGGSNYPMPTSSTV